MADIKIYGELYEYGKNNAEAICQQIESVAKGEVINIHMHCYGGSVIEGNMIYNAIKSSHNPVDIYVDGVAASMGAIMCLAARKVYMSENAWMMIHAPLHCGYGTYKELAKACKMLRSMETLFKKSLSAKTGKDDAMITSWLDGDNWFSSKEALEIGLIDGIVEPVADSVIIDNQADNKDVKQAYALFKAHFKAQFQSQPQAEPSAHSSVQSSTQAINNNINTNNNKTVIMNKQELITKYALVGVTELSSEADIFSAIDVVLSKERASHTEAQQELGAMKRGQIEAMLNPLKSKMTDAERSHYEAIGETMGLEALATSLKPLQSKPTFTEVIASGNGGASSTSNTSWSWDDYQERNASALERMPKENPDKFNALYKAKYGVEPLV